MLRPCVKRSKDPNRNKEEKDFPYPNKDTIDKDLDQGPFENKTKECRNKGSSQ